jgi:hypothetical protein
MTGDAPLEEPPPQVLAGGTPLIFDWRPVRWRKTRLMVALAAAAAGHLLVFYLFQVVTESSPRQAPPVREAMILSGTQEATRRLLETVDDRLPALSGPVPLESAGADTLAELVKGYVPTWQDHRPVLKLLPGQGGAAALPALIPGPDGVLPPLPAAVPEARPVVLSAPGRPQPVLSFQSGFAARAPLAPPVWPPAVMAADWPEEGPVSFMISVDPSGKVVSCLSLGKSSGLDEVEVESLRAVLLKLRFGAKPVPGEVEWGWVDVLW